LQVTGKKEDEKEGYRRLAAILDAIGLTPEMADAKLEVIRSRQQALTATTLHTRRGSGHSDEDDEESEDLELGDSRRAKGKSSSAPSASAAAASSSSSSSSLSARSSHPKTAPTPEQLGLRVVADARDRLLRSVNSAVEPYQLEVSNFFKDYKIL
jgi:hypothetical protein